MTPRVRGRLAPAAAARQIISRIVALPSERVPLPAARGRVLAERIVSLVDIPPWNNSAMDGYAARMGSRRPRPGSSPLGLNLVETIPAGTFPTRRLGPGECARVFTGAPVPEGADTVFRQEDATRLDATRVRINNPRDAGKNVRRRGDDIRRGSTVLAPGVELGAAPLGVLASVGTVDVAVHRRPRVAFLATGDEIADLDARADILAGRKIASSNSYALGALIRDAGGEPVNLGIARDDPADLRRRIRFAADCDLLLTTGGISVGEHDHVRSVLHELGLELVFWRVRMRPGAPVGFGLLKGRPWIGLPGNPVSAMVTFELFARPAIRKLRGHRALFRRSTAVRAGQRLTLGPRLRHFLRVTLRGTRGGAPTARLTGPQSSGVLTSMVKADALLIVPETVRVVRKGRSLQALRLREAEYVARPPF